VRVAVATRSDISHFDIYLCISMVQLQEFSSAVLVSIRGYLLIMISNVFVQVWRWYGLSQAREICFS